MRPVYINGIGIVSAQRPDIQPDPAAFEVVPDDPVIRAILPDYTGLIPPAMARRMSRVVKMSIYAAEAAMKDQSGNEAIDAIIVGTGSGCIVDSEKFLNHILDQDEEHLTPTLFIQSTHNTIAGQIALNKQCNAYNMTYVQEGNSFSSALLDTLLQFEGQQVHQVLLGAADEISERSVSLYQHLGIIRKENELQGHSQENHGFQAGEGAVFFRVSAMEGDHSYACISDVQLYQILMPDQISSACDAFLGNNHLSSNDIDLVVLGYNGSIDDQACYQEVERYFPDAASMEFKKFYGEFETAEAMGVAMAAKVCKEQVIPAEGLRRGGSRKEIRNILIYNHFMNRDHSFILMKKCPG